jgi:hypothetical protein
VGHPRCDRCQGALGAPDDLHYTITIEIEAEGYVDDQDFDSSEDKLANIEDLIDAADEVCSADFGDEWYQRRQYSVCKSCYVQYIKNPLSKPSQ